MTADIEKAEARINAINELFCNPGFFDQTQEGKVRKLELEQKGLSAEVDELMEAWEETEKELGELVSEPVASS